MTPPLLTAEQAEQVRTDFAARGLSVLIVEGEREPADFGQDLIFAPSRWAVLDKPHNHWCSDDCAPQCWYDSPDGRQVWELRTECPRAGCWNDCHGSGRYWYDEDTPMAGQMRPHWRTCDSGCRPARCTVQVVPVVAHDDDSFEHGPGHPHICVYAGFALLVDERGDRADTFIGPDSLPVPGRDFGVVLREAT